VGFEPVVSTPEEFAKQMKVESATRAEVIRAAKIKAP
jgi:hypothetical protein